MQKFCGRVVLYIYSRCSRCSADRRSSTGLSLVSPTNVKAPKSFLFTEGSPKVDFLYIYIYFVDNNLYFRQTLRRIVHLTCDVTH